MADKKKQGNRLSRHDLMCVKSAKRYLLSCVESLDDREYRQAAKHVFDTPAFWTCPAAKSRHQAYPGGLAIHTAQMLECAIGFVGPIAGMRTDAMIVAAMWHDIGKIEDYQIVDVTEDNPSGYEYTEHQTMIGHLSKGYTDFMTYCAVEGIICGDGQRDFIGHLILAHHGRKEWGSPVEPVCAEAWALHCGDMMSAHFIADEAQPR